MKKIFALIFAVTLVFSLTGIFVAAEDTAITVKTVTFDGDPAEVAAVPMASQTLDVLIDGNNVSTATGFSTSGIVLFQNKKCTEAGVYPEYSIVMELNEATDIGGVTLDFYKEYMSMIGLPKDNTIDVEYSTDGSAFFPVDSFTFVGEAVQGEIEVQTVELAFDSAITAKYIKVTMAYGDSPFTGDAKVVWEWQGLTEVGVVAGTISDESIVEESTTDESTSTPDTGDYGYVAFIALAVVTLAGAIVVKRVR
ncbi:MAG: hypothetical protein A2Y17_03455 [Clostridiales bacterium GWF2_38_85]|nr:MAG: hypothetical protein A2Y17_03455 [Clostridiales bacterium GWF2_38_85]HBL85264.1 hypothetical protein [Clostridiales bacterium]